MEQKKYKVDIEIYKDFKDVNIYGYGLNYAEMGGTHNGCQSNDCNKNKDVKQICLKIADLFRELIDVNTGHDTDVTTKTQMSDIKLINTPEKYECDIKGHFFKDEYLNGRWVASRCVFCGKSNGINGL